MSRIESLVKARILELFAEKTVADSATYAAVNPALFDAYSTKGTAPLTVADSGQTWYNYPASGDSAMTIIGGCLTTADTSATQTAGYAQHDFAAPVTRIGGRITFGPSTTGGGSFAFPIWTRAFDGTTLNGSIVPDTSCHLVVTPQGASIDKILSGTATRLATWTFTTPLTQDGTTVYTIDATRDGNTWTLLLPDGRIVTTTNAAYGATLGTIACFETYAAVASTDLKARAVEVWADASAPDTKRAAVTPGQMRATVAAAVTALAGDTSWTAPTFVNSWANVGLSGYTVAGYRKDAAGVVHLKGLVNGTNGMCFALPSGYLPAAVMMFICQASAGAVAMTVDNYGGVSGAQGGNAWVSLDGISFIAEG